MEEQLSKLKVYSLGTVATNKELNSNEVEVLLVEVSPMVDGEITDNAVTTTASGGDAVNGQYQSTTTTTSTVKAKWLPIGDSQRQTAPDVRRGEEVVIYRFGDSDAYFWVTKLNDLKFRKLETVVYGYSGTSNEGASPNEDNTYLIEINTHQGYYRIHTSQANGEFCGYDLKIDGKNGQVSIKDTIGNLILLDSKAKQIRLENVSGSFFDLTDTVAQLQTAEHVSIKTTTLDIEAQTTHKGNIAVLGNISGAAGPGGDGSGTFAGSIQLQRNLKVDGNADVAGTLHAGHVISDQPITAPNV